MLEEEGLSPLDSLRRSRFPLDTLGLSVPDDWRRSRRMADSLSRAPDPRARSRISSEALVDTVPGSAADSIARSPMPSGAPADTAGVPFPDSPERSRDEAPADTTGVAPPADTTGVAPPDSSETREEP
jgi:hypothetical protein